MLKRLSLLLATSLFATVYSKDLGVQGAVFEIKEQSLLEVIYAKLRALESTNKIGEHQKEIQEKVKNSIENPLPVSGIKTGTIYTSRNYDPSIIIDEDIKDQKGTLIALKGTHINPLDFHSFGRPLVLIKGDDNEQVEWAIKQDAKILLVSGKPQHLARANNKIFYFDQGAVLSRKFNIKAVPARISQKGKMLLIEEIPLVGSSVLQTKGDLKNE